MYSNDKIIDTLMIYNNRKIYDLSINHILTLMKIARSTLYIWVSKQQHLLNPKYKLSKRISKHINKNCKFKQIIKDDILKSVTTNPTCNIKKLAKKISRKYDIAFNKNYIYKILKDNNITKKHIQYNSYPYNRRKFKKEVKQLKSNIDNVNNNFISVDETAVYLNITPTTGWAVKGKKCCIKKPLKRSKKYSMCTAISKKGIIAYKIIDGSFNTNRFNDFIFNDVLPKMTNNAILIDNCSIHKSQILKNTLKDNDKHLIFNVPYSPQFNPIEYVFNTLKSDIKKSNVTTYDAMDKCIKKNIKNLNRKKLTKYYRHTYDNLLLACTT